MKIGIFSKFHIAGGSEFRCVEMANAIAKYTDNESYLLCEKELPDKLQSAVREKNVNVVKNVFLPNGENKEKLYDMDCILTVNTDSKDFSTFDFWNGKSPSHNQVVDLTRIKQMVFLYNFIVSPSRHLFQLEKYCNNIKIATTNSKFFSEISDGEKYEMVRHFPRIRMESPIEPETITTDKIPSPVIRFGMHSKPMDSKWNSELVNLIDQINKRYTDKVEWSFLGMPGDMMKKMSKFSNVKMRKEFSIPVKDFLMEVDVFLFYPSWKREEPWARVVAEGLMSGCPVITTNKGGNKDQILHGNNGFLCKDYNDIFRHVVYCIEHPKLVNKMSKNSIRFSRTFSSETIIKKFVDFIRD